MQKIVAFIRSLIAPFLSSSDKKTAAKGVSWLAGDKVVKLVIGMVTGAMVARYLQPDQYGVFNTVTAYIALFGPIANFGLTHLYMRELAAHPEDERKIVGTSVVLRIAGSLVGFVLPVLFYILIHQSSQIIILTIVASISQLCHPTEAFDYWYQSKNRADKIVIGRQIAYIVTTIFRVVAIFMNLGLVAILLSYVLEDVLGGIVMVIFAQFDFHFLGTLRFDKEIAIRLTKEAFPIILSGLGVAVYMKIDKVIMQWLTTETVIGIYSAATKMSELWFFVPYSLSSVFSPLISTAKHTNQQVYEKRVMKSFVLTNYLSYAICLATTIGAPILILLFFGDKYKLAIPALMIHIWSLPFVAMGLMQDIWLINERLQKVQVMRTVIASIINILINIWLVPSLGAVGAALATLIAYTFPNFLLNATSKKTMPLFITEAKSFLINRENINLLLQSDEPKKAAGSGEKLYQ